MSFFLLLVFLESFIRVSLKGWYFFSSYKKLKIYKVAGKRQLELGDIRQASRDRFKKKRYKTDGLVAFLKDQPEKKVFDDKVRLVALTTTLYDLKNTFFNFYQKKNNNF